MKHNTPIINKGYRVIRRVLYYIDILYVFNQIYIYITYPLSHVTYNMKYNM